MLATARAFLATSGLVAIYFDPTEPTRYAEIAYLLLLVYAAQSLALMLWLRLQPRAASRLRLVSHGVDVIFAGLLTLFTEGANSPLYVFFLFVLLAAAYRWGARETLLTAGAAAGVLLLEIGLSSVESLRAVHILSEPVEFNRVIMRSTYLVLMGVLLGYLAEEEKQLRAETAVVARVVSRAQSASSLRANLQAALEEIFRVYGTRRALLPVRERASDRVFLWEARAVGESPEILLTLREDESEQRVALLRSPAGRVWYAVRDADHSQRFSLLALDAQGRRLREVEPALPPALTGQSFRSVLGAAIQFGGEWEGQLLLFDVALGSRPETELRFLQALLRQVGPAIYNVYLLRRLRARAGALERARVAQELHDGVIQSLIALEMQFDVLRRRPPQGPEVTEEIGRLQRLLHQEILNVRELMQQMKPVEIDPQRLLEFLAETVDRFQRDTGIAARFVSELDEVRLPPRVCRELARIVQEALVNVRKHSSARNVLVRFGCDDGVWRLVVDDDGRGFPFSGRLTQAELDAARRGPLVIKERVRSIGGELTVESTPGGGARLEITLPQAPTPTEGLEGAGA
ncbi:MAG TPA: histidine kinase [Candidatus Xenobia bacterium]|nr:histidine kinase [Candidatus Xenobia bacterium]